MSLFGLLNVNKPEGVTSRRAVDRVQRLVRPLKVGHAGTLDPLACGVLVIGIGQATRLVEYVQQMPKHYRGTFLLGRKSDTEDIEGQVVELADARQPTLDELQIAAQRFQGESPQRPPAFSALKVAGKRAYDLARSGREFELAPRTVRVDRLEIVRYDYPELCLDVQCGAGTYIRSLGRDLAEQVGTGAVMSALERRAIGRFRIEDAIPLAEVDRNRLEQRLMPATAAVEGVMPAYVVSLEDVRRLADGRSITLEAPPAEQCAALDETNRLVAILRHRQDDTFRPEKYFPT